MLLCCFREPKEAKKRPLKGRGGGVDRLEHFDHEYPPAAELIGVKKASYNNTSLSRPLKTTGLFDTPSSLSSNTAGGESEVLVASVTYHGQPQVASSGSRYRHSVCSYTSGSLTAGGGGSRPPSRDGSDRRDHKERAPISRETKKMLKQKSQESFKDNNKSVTSIPYIDASPPSSNGLGGLSCSKASFVSSPSHKVWPANTNPQSGGGGGGPGAASTPNLPTSTPTHQPTLPVVISQQQQQQQRPIQVAKMTSEETSLSSSSNLILNGSSNQLAKAEEKIQGRGMCRSNASYGIQQLLQEQICKEEQENQAKLIEKEVKSAVAKVSASYEERLSAARAENSLKIQQVLRDKTTAVNNVRNTFETELKRQLATFERDLHELKCKQNNEIQDMESRCHQQLKVQEEKHQEIIAQYEARDEAWQAEKEDVLNEITRLKEEANRFISILSQEDDPEKTDELLSPGKRQSLTREVESLQLVVEMRTAELHKLREERTRHLQQLEELEKTKAMLEKANARVEDLTVQLAAKTELERQLSWEKSQLENFFQTETKNKTRISMQVEELQWRIKHNKELPPPQVFSPATSIATTGENDNSSLECNGSQATPTTPTIVMNNGTKVEDFNRNEPSVKRPTSIDGLRPHLLEVPNHKRASTHSEDSLEEEEEEEDDEAAKDIENGNTTGSDEEEKRDGIKDSEDEDDDEAGLSDEGLGDITSEASNSPQPPQLSSHQNSALNKNTYVVKSSEDCDNNPVVHVTQPRNTISNKSEVFSVKSEVIKNTSTTTSSSLPTSPCDERVPSRIAFPKPRKSQTHL